MSTMGIPKKLTEMQMKFAHEIVTNEGRMNGEECARIQKDFHSSLNTLVNSEKNIKRNTQ